MSLLTKIFVVIVTVLSLLAVALLIPFVNNAAQYKTKFEEASQAQKTAETRAALAQSDLDRLLTSRAEATQEKDEKIAELEKRYGEALTEIQQKQVALVETTNQLNDTRARLGELSSALDTNAAIIRDLDQEVSQRRESMLELEKKNIQLNDQLQDTQTQLATAVQQVRLLRENISGLEDEIGKLQEVIAKGGSGNGGPAAQVSQAVASKPILGVVTDVLERDSSVFAAINIGTNDSVAEGMEFIIHDNGKFMGNLTVTKVDLNSSAGVVSLAQGEIKPNLKVQTGSDF